MSPIVFESSPDEPALLFEATPHDAAVRFIAQKPVMAREAFARLLPDLQARAFLVSGVTSFDVVADIREAVAGLPAGGDWDEIKDRVLADLHPFLVDDSLKDSEPERWQKQVEAAERRAELIVRTHGQQAYAVTQWEMLDANRVAFPYWQYQSMGDNHVRDSHRLLDGIVLPHDHPFWLTHFPPWEFGCRCMVVGLTRADYDQIKAEDEKRPPEKRLILEGPILEKLERDQEIWRGTNLKASTKTPLERSAETGETPYVFRPDTLKLSFEEILKRYDPETAGDFTAWAKRTPVRPGEKQTIFDWLNESDSQAGRRAPKPASPAGSAPAKPEPAKPEPAKPEPAKPEPAKPEPAKPESAKSGPAKPERAKPTPAKPGEPQLQQPVPPSHEGVPVARRSNDPDVVRQSADIPQDMIDAIDRHLQIEPPTAVPNAPDIPASVLDAERAIAREPVEHRRTFAPDGRELSRAVGVPDRVPVGADATGSIVTHNHPGQLPPSLGDMEALLDLQPLAVRVVTLDAVYEIRAKSKIVADAVTFWRKWADAVINLASLRFGPDAAQRTAQFDIMVQRTMLRLADEAGLLTFTMHPPPEPLPFDSIDTALALTDTLSAESPGERMLDASPEFGGLSDHEWMRRRAVALQKAIAEGRITFAGKPATDVTQSDGTSGSGSGFVKDEPTSPPPAS